MHRTTLLLIVGLALLTACRSNSSTNNPNKVPAATESPLGPGIYPQAEAAEVISQHMGHHDVLAYEFQGIWLECWLEYQINDELVEKSHLLKVSPANFGNSKRGASDPKQIAGTITCFGNEHHTMKLLLRSTYSHSETEKFYTGGSWPAEITIPSTDTKFKSSRGSFDSGWADPIALPGKVGDEFTLQSWGWEEFDDVSGKPITRAVKVSLKARQLTGDVESIEPPSQTTD